MVKTKLKEKEEERVKEGKEKGEEGKHKGEEGKHKGEEGERMAEAIEEKASDKAMEAKAKALDLAVGQIEKQFGKGSIMKLGQDFKLDVPAIPTGSVTVDAALGVGGVPRGRVIEVFGPEASGKTTLTLSIIANAQRMGGQAAFIDAEHAFDPGYAKKIGVNLDNLLMSQPDTGEQALEIAETLVKSNAVDIIAIDSVAALTPRAEIEGDIGDSHMGLQARLMSQALRKLSGSISKSKTCVIFINQIREKIGVFFGNPETTPGGRALKFYASVRIDLRRIASLKKGEETVGSRVRASIVKNKVAPPFRKAEFDIMFDEGISRAGSILDMAETLGILQKSGAWLLYGEEKIGQGKENARVYLKENPKVADKLEKEIREKSIS
jgi:recombination protein RecA